jgi:hypothetical protein
VISYRVIKTTTTGFTSPPEIETGTVWQGSYASELSKEYPPSPIPGADPLGHSEIEDGLIRFDFHFEKTTGNGIWEKCPDPRRRITALTATERAIEAENRRDFPGDYGLADDDQEDHYFDDGPDDDELEDDDDIYEPIGVPYDGYPEIGE